MSIRSTAHEGGKRSEGRGANGDVDARSANKVLHVRWIRFKPETCTANAPEYVVDQWIQAALAMHVTVTRSHDDKTIRILFMILI